MTTVNVLLKQEPARDRYGRYLVRLPGDKKATGRTRVTTFIRALDQGDGLIAWKATATMVGALRNPGLMAKWAAVFAQSIDPWYASDDLKTKCKKLVDECADHGGAQSRASLGTALHTMVELVARGETPELVSPYREDVEAWVDALLAVDLHPMPEWTEVCVYIAKYDLVGTFDGLFVDIEGKRYVLGDLKTETSTDYKSLNHAAQLAAYSLATHRIIFPTNPEDECTLQPLPEFDRDTGLIVHLPAGEARCELHAVDLAQGRDALEVAHTMRRLDAQRKRKDNGGLMRPWTGVSDRVVVGPTSGSVAPATTPNQEQPCPTPTPLISTDGMSTGPATPNTATDTTPTPSSSESLSTTTPPTDTTITTSSTADTDTLKTRLARIKTEHPDLYRLIINRWPAPGLRYHELNPTEHTAVLALVDELDIEGPRVDPADIQLAADKYAALTDQQRERILQWARECEDNSFRAFGVGGGNHTTRRLALLETCIAVAQEGITDLEFGLLLSDALPAGIREFRPIGHTLGHMNWRQAEQLWANLRAYVSTNQPTEQP